MPLLTVDNNPTQAPPMGGLENIPPISPVIPGPQFHTVQQTSPSTAHHVDNPQILQSTAPTLPVNRPIPQPPLYVHSSMPSAAQPTPVVPRSAFTATDHPHPPWYQQRDLNWQSSTPQWSVPHSAAQFSIPGTMQYPVTLPPGMPSPGYPPWTSGPPLSQPYVTPVLPPAVSSQYTYQHPAPAAPPPVSSQHDVIQSSPQHSSSLLPSQRPNLMEMAISSSYGIPKPNLIRFTTGKESDFLLLKKGLDGVLGPHPHLSEDYKFQVLLDHLKFPPAFQLAKRYVHDTMPFTKAMQALQQRYGQPRQLVQGEINNILRAPTVKAGDAQGFEDFALSVSSLVGLLNSMEGAAKSELECGSHVDRLLSKLPFSYQDSFAEYCLAKGILRSDSANTYTLPDFAQWLERKSQAIQIARRATESYISDKPRSDRRDKSSRPLKTSSSVYYGTDKPTTPTANTTSAPTDSKERMKGKKREKFKPYCPFCSSTEHYLSSCSDFSKLSTT